MNIKIITSKFTATLKQKNNDNLINIKECFRHEQGKLLIVGHMWLVVLFKIDSKSDWK